MVNYADDEFALQENTNSHKLIITRFFVPIFSEAREQSRFISFFQKSKHQFPKHVL